jgi:carboxymethylenebutenolidase
MSLPIVTTDVSYPCSDGFAMPAYLARPEGDGTYPAMVLTVEATGLHREMKRLADDVAKAGYVVIAPDLFARGNAFLCLVRLIKDLMAEKGRGVDDLLAARAWLAAQAYVASDRVATMGFCLGGGYALLLAKTGLFKAAADFYGQPPATLEGACPIVASYGDRDAPMMGHVPKLQAELSRLAIPNDVKVYPGVGHGFMNEQPNKIFAFLLKNLPGHVAYDAAAADDAMSRMLAFLAAHV